MGISEPPQLGGFGPPSLLFPREMLVQCRGRETRTSVKTRARRPIFIPRATECLESLLAKMKMEEQRWQEVRRWRRV